MKRTGAGLVVKALEDEGVAFAFGIPGTHNIELYDALATSHTVRTVLVTDEQSASFMADGLWRASGRLGCVNVVPGAGLTHALSGIAEAFLDNVPLLVLGCGVRRDSRRAFQLHDIDQQALVRPVVKESWLVERTADLYSTIRTACRVARDGAPGPVFVEVPAHLYMVSEEADDAGGEHTLLAGPGEGSSGFPPSGARAKEGGEGVPRGLREGPDASDLAAAAELLSDSRRPLLYLGAGARGATGSGGTRIVELAELLEAPVATTFQGKGVFPESHDLFLWNGFGDAAPPFVRKVAGSCDALLAVGCRFSEVGTGSYGIDIPGPLVHVDVDAEVFHRNYPAEVTVQSDGATFVDALLEILRTPGSRFGAREPDDSLRSAIREGHRKVWDTWLEAKDRGRVSPPRLLKALQEHLGSKAIFATDSGNGTFLAVECLRLHRPGRFLAPVDFSCMGYAVPAALGAKLGRPDAPVVALAGDGAFLMTGLEMISSAREGLGVIVLVLRDRELAQIAQFQETALGRKVSSQVVDYDLESLARGMDVDYLRLSSDDEMSSVLTAAATLAEAGKPVLVDVDVDYSRKTYFTRGVVKTNLLRLPLKDQVRFVGRALMRRLTG